jgi:thiamine biosynthesis lipoprotein
MASVQLATLAMATRFEFVLQGSRPSALRSAGEEAIAEIQRLDATLSVHRPESEIAALNRDAGSQPVRVSPEVFRLLQHAIVLSQAASGAFDITVGPLLKAWGFVRGTGHLPDPTLLETARATIGPHQVVFDEASMTIQFAHPGTRIDLGAIGKGYALDRAAALLQEAGVANALLHGGTSTAVAWGQPENTDAWRIAIDPPLAEPAPSVPPSPIAVAELHNESLSVSAVWGKGFSQDGLFYGHIIDPRTGHPTQGALLAAMILPSATESDALSTALLVRGSEMVSCLREANAPARCLVAIPIDEPPGYRIDAWGIAGTDPASRKNPGNPSAP